MGVYTTTANGNWSASGTWTGGAPAGGPGSGDTVTIAHNVTIDAAAGSAFNGAVIIGDDSGSAISAGNSSTVVTLTVASGCSLRAKGDVTVASGFFMALEVAAGGAFYFYPPSDGTTILKYNCAYVGQLICNGTSGSHAIFGTDLSRGGSTLNGYVTVGIRPGLITATYTDFSNLGSATLFGLQCVIYSADAVNFTVTNCTFNKCNGSFGFDSSFTGSLNFSHNIITNSIAYASLSGTFPVAWQFSPPNGTAVTGTIDSNSFDTSVYVYSLSSFVFSNNYMNGGLDVASTQNWTTGQFIGNFLTIDNSDGNAGWPVFGPVSGCYCVMVTTGNAHFFLFGNDVTSAATFENCIAEAPNTSSGVAQWLITGAPAGTVDLTIQNNITLRQAALGVGCELTSIAGLSTNISATVLHNTVAVDAIWGISLGESGTPPSGQVTAIKGNLFWATTPVSTLIFKAVDAGHGASGGVSNIVSPANADYNGSWNCDTAEPSDYVGNTYSGAGNGYQCNLTTYAGTHDLADQNPSFVDHTRTLATWGGTTAGGGTATVTGAMAALAANPALINQAVTGLIPWVRAGYVPTNAALKAASYPGDPSTTDAAGNAWAGAGPGIGAMSFTGSPTPTPTPTATGAAQLLCM